jgi:alpha-1,3-rhamnosyl/mannosyltransferase
VTQGGYPGIGRATVCLVEALLRRQTAHQLLLLYQAGRPLPERVRLAVRPPHRLLSTETALRTAADQVTTPRRLRGARVELFHSLYYAQALVPGIPYVLAVHDLIPVFYRQYWPAAQGRLIRWWLHRASLGARHLITPSAASADDLARAYGVSLEGITVAPWAADVGWLDCPGGAGEQAPGDGRYLLCVCTNKPHKNLTRLVEAYGLLRRRHADAPNLVIAGGWDERYPAPAEAAARLPEAGMGRVRFVRHPDDATLRSLYRRALGFVFPSEYEGFGLPVLEAMVMGLPVAASSTPAVAEVAGDACLGFDPLDTGAMADCMAKLVWEPDLRATLRAAGLARAAKFSWEETAIRTLAAYEAALCG